MDHPWTEYVTSGHHDEHHADIARLRVDREADNELLARKMETIAGLREALGNAHGILQTNLGDTDPHVRAACDLMWNALKEIT